MRRRATPPIVFLAALVGCTALAATPASAQHAVPGPGEARAPAAAPVLDALRTPAGAFTASLLVPGAGQAALDRRRWALYAALEVAFWAVRLDARSDQRVASRGYRDLAWEAARMSYTDQRVDGSWGYYETMGQYQRSGAFDADPTRAGVQPEEDVTTYNGSVWELSRALYLPGGEGEPGSPGYDRALAYYSEKAAGPAFLWSWAGEAHAWDRFGGLIDEADQASRVAAGALGAVLANHFVSATDALIIARLRTDSPVRLRSRIVAADPLRWSVGLHIPVKDPTWTFPLKR